MTRFRVLSLIGCALALLAGCAAEGSELSGQPGAPSSEGEPSVVGDACRTEDDCSSSEQCVALGGGSFACVPIDAAQVASARGPKGQPPPPAGLVDAAPGPRTRPEGRQP